MILYNNGEEAMKSRAKFANTAVIKALQAMVIELSNTGVIRSKGFDGVDGSVPGFELRASDGAIEGNNAKFKNIDISGDSTYRGDIVTPTLSLTKESPLGQQYTVATGSGAKTIFDYMGLKNETIIGTYGNTAIHHIESSMERESSTGVWNNASISYFQDIYRYYVTYTDGIRVLIAHTRYKFPIIYTGTPPSPVTTNYATTSGVLTFRGVSEGQTMRILNLDDNIPAVPGTVFTQPATVQGQAVKQLFIR